MENDFVWDYGMTAVDSGWKGGTDLSVGPSASDKNGCADIVPSNIPNLPKQEDLVLYIVLEKMLGEYLAELIRSLGNETVLPWNLTPQVSRGSSWGTGRGILCFYKWIWDVNFIEGVPSREGSHLTIHF